MSNIQSAQSNNSNLFNELEAHSGDRDGFDRPDELTSPAALWPKISLIIMTQTKYYEAELIQRYD